MRPILTIHLNHIAENYLTLKKAFHGRDVAAVVKANAYGLGMEQIAPALLNAGCTWFFVATLEEGVALRQTLLAAGVTKTYRIAIFTGPYAGQEADYIEHELLPVINHIPQLERWALVTKRHASADYLLHVDTGMTRLGLTISDVEWLAKHHTLSAEKPLYLMSHLACANEPEHEKNAEQLARFQKARELFTDVAGSLCNSSGIYLPPEYHANLARPGCALYGINPTPGKPNPMRNVAHLSAPIIMVRELDQDETVGYGATATAKKGSKIALIQLGYADGLLRCLSNNMHGYIQATACPILGRVSMDMIALDVSNIPESALHTGMMVDVLSDLQPVDALADAAGTIGYEIFTRLGSRIERKYIS